MTAQNVTVKGKLVSADDKAGLPYVTISVARESNPANTVKRLATQENGTFSTALTPGKYIFIFHFVGMNGLKKLVEVSTSQNPLDLGEIAMDESSIELEEVSVTAQKPLVKVEIDKLTYSAKDDPESSTSNVLDLLRKVPLVTVDGEDEIQLKGSSNFKIYLNGKPSNMISGNPSQVLKSMPANSVKDIEVITDPGVKYDAEGVGGIINIVTDKRVDDGYSGSVGANGDNFGGYGGNAYLATKYGKFGFTGNAGYFHHERPESESGFTREEFSPQNLLTLNGKNKSDGGGLFLSGALSFEPDTLNLFNLSGSRYGGKFKSHSMQDALSSGARPYSYNTRSNSTVEYGGMSLSADYQRSFKRKGEMLTISYRFEDNPNDSEYDSEYENVTGVFYYTDGYKLRSVNNAGGKEHTGQLDYVNPLNGKHSIETGLKYIFRDNTSRADHTFFDTEEGVWKPDVSRKNDLDHTQNITSGYAGYGFKSGKTGVKLGFRGEYTQQEIHFMGSQLDTIVQTNFFDLVPSVTLSYQLGMTRTLRGGYNMRISRPGIWYLNPYVNDVDPNNISYGNPNLDAEKQHNFNINYGAFSQKLNFNVTLSYAFARNAVTGYSFIENGVTHNTYANIGKNQTVGTNLYVSWTPTQVVRTYLNGGINYTDIRSTEKSELRNSGFSGRAFGGLTFTFPGDFRVGANGGLFLNRIQLQTKQSPFYFYSFSLMKSFLNKKLDLSLNLQDVLSKNRKISSTTTGEGFWQENIFHYPMRSIRLSVSYRFGELKASMKKVQRTISNEDLMQGEGSQQNTTTPPAGGN
ncbi:outer membrane beta-barrel family protein [Proteiniphilum propionicum]|uniref:outer membrane beta-barrel family protein n=1 Tax=Proteiniphilum propionicum TaxID=2829812 RepID=UPI001EE9C5CE|nr:outer membrane beta-barrel family protein [Proteiniphilum propionicum]ULB34628.1 TonB-dependent receptor [Proteiniphilum propionicum]